MWGAHEDNAQLGGCLSSVYCPLPQGSLTADSTQVLAMVHSQHYTELQRSSTESFPVCPTGQHLNLTCWPLLPCLLFWGMCPATNLNNQPTVNCSPASGNPNSLAISFFMGIVCYSMKSSSIKGDDRQWGLVTSKEKAIFDTEISTAPCVPTRFLKINSQMGLCIVFGT